MMSYVSLLNEVTWIKKLSSNREDTTELKNRNVSFKCDWDTDRNNDDDNEIYRRNKFFGFREWEKPEVEVQKTGRRLWEDAGKGEKWQC